MDPLDLLVPKVSLVVMDPLDLKAQPAHLVHKELPFTKLPTVPVHPAHLTLIKYLKTTKNE